MTMLTLTEEEWVKARLGKLTSSRVSDALAKQRDPKKPGMSRKYAAQLIMERTNNRSYENGYKSPAMQGGIAKEAQARANYVMQCGVDLIEAPEGHRLWVEHPTIRNAGATPDSLVKGRPGIVEFKCPESVTQLERWDDRDNPNIEREYLLQICWQLACMPEMEWADFASFDPEQKPRMQLIVHRMWRDNDAIADLEQHVRKFLDEVEKRTARYRADCEAV